MNLRGFIIGFSSFLVIGIFHPIVIKAEYYFTKKIWPVFFAAGLILSAACILISDLTISAIVGVTAFSCFWSIGEIFHQEERVRKGWFPSNPRRNK